jgi:mRNA-degrading endonuclease RelE of RelBE toxin-antitoxin system
MSWEVVWARAAAKDLRRLDTVTERRIHEASDDLRRPARAT